MTRLIPALLGAFLVAIPALGQTSFPMVSHSHPTAVQRGITSEVEVFSSMDIGGAYKVLFDGRGVSATVVGGSESAPMESAMAGSKKTVNLRSIKLKVTVAADAPCGVREFRVATPLGISSLGQLLVTDVPVVKELPGNSVASRAQPMPMPGVMCGIVGASEEVDYYKFKARAGQLLSIEVASARIEDKIHDLQKHIDPFVAVFDAAGLELASSDDGFFADPYLTFAVPADGEYVVQVRDARYDGDPRWVYALTVTDRPHVAHLFPLAANPGQEVTFTPVGTAGRMYPSYTAKAPTETGIHLLSLPYAGGETNTSALIVTKVPVTVEQEPNDTPEKANRLSVPGGVSGKMGVKRDLDHFVFKGTKGKAIQLEVFARRFGTPLDSNLDAVIDVFQGEKVVASNDDGTNRGKDPMLVFKPTADDDYVVRVRDLNSKGGDGYVYYLEADFAQPDFAVKCDPSKAMIGPGGRTAWYVTVTREDGFTGPVTVDVAGLPKGVTVNPLTIPANMTVGCLVVSAEAGAKPDASMVTVTGTAEFPDEAGKPAKRTKRATPVEEIYFPGGGRGQFTVGMQAAAVTGPSDLTNVTVSMKEVVLKPGEEVKIDVEIVRKKDFDKGVSLDVILRHLGGVFANPLPPGVTLVENKSKTLLGTASKGHIVLKAAADAAPCENVPVCVQGFVAVNFVVKIGYASEPILVTVKK